MIGVGGPWTHLYGSIEVAGGSKDLTAEVRDPGPYEVDQPLVTAVDGSAKAAGSCWRAGWRRPSRPAPETR